MHKNKAAKINKGIHTPSDRKPVHHVNDLTFKFDNSKSGLYLNFLKRPGRVSGVVEKIFGASRYKVWVPSENCIIILAVQGLYCEQPDKPEKKTFSPYYDLPQNSAGNRGFLFARDFLFQRDVEVIVNDVEKNGCFHGRVYYNGEDIAPILLREGFARINNNTAKSMEEYESYKQAELIAKNHEGGPLNMWEKYDPKEEEDRKQRYKDEREAERQQNAEKIKVIITEITDGSNFYYQVIGEKTDQLNALMQEVNNSNIDNSAPHNDPKYQELVFAKFSVDNKYYRGRVLGVKEIKEEKRNEYRVLFIDFGNTEILSKESIRVLDLDTYGQLEPLARSGRLLYVKSPKFTADYGQEAAELFRDLVWEKELVGIVQARDRTGVAFLNLGDPNSKTHINAHMVKEGYARIENRPKEKDPLYLKLKEEEDIARLNKIGMWEHGTVPDSDEEREEEKMKKGIL